MEEKIVTLNLRRELLKVPRWRRSIEAVKILKKKLKRIAKDEVIIDKKLNERILSKKEEKLLAKVRIKIRKTDDKIKAELVE